MHKNSAPINGIKSETSKKPNKHTVKDYRKKHKGIETNIDYMTKKTDKQFRFPDCLSATLDSIGFKSYMPKTEE